jgi:hypothetical protein
MKYSLLRLNLVSTFSGQDHLPKAADELILNQNGYFVEMLVAVQPDDAYTQPPDVSV